jgi:hypothetical protein
MYFVTQVQTCLLPYSVEEIFPYETRQQLVAVSSFMSKGKSRLPLYISNTSRQYQAYGFF